METGNEATFVPRCTEGQSQLTSSSSRVSWLVQGFLPEPSSLLLRASLRSLRGGGGGAEREDLDH